MVEMKHRTASEDAALKARGVDPHPAAALPDPPFIEWAEDRRPQREARYGGELANILQDAGERLVDSDGLSRPLARGDTPKRKRPKRYRAGCTDLSVDAALGHSALDTLWTGPGAPERSARLGLVKSVLEAVKPRNELEGMVATQMIAAHGAAMEAYRRAAIPTQNFAAYSESLNQAAKASRTFAVLLEALDKHRGKGSQ